LYQATVYSQILVTLQWRGKNKEVDVRDDTRGRDIITAAMTFAALPKERVRLVYTGADGQRIPVQPDALLSSIPAKLFQVRDLGPQINYRAVYVIEYAGPLLIWPLIRWIIHPNAAEFITCAGAMWTFHYGKRILESLFVHSFSHGTMALFNLFKNCAYYLPFDKTPVDVKFDSSHRLQ
jgi:very-long-chain enoyl-CoA reductase